VITGKSRGKSAELTQVLITVANTSPTNLLIYIFGENMCF